MVEGLVEPFLGFGLMFSYDMVEGLVEPSVDFGLMPCVMVLCDNNLVFRYKCFID